MDAIAEVSLRKSVRAWVQFEQRDVEDKEASRREGKYVGKDIEYVLITPAYGKDDVHKKVTAWLADLEIQVQMGRISQEDLTFYRAKYDAWKQGLAMPLGGSPIKGWGVLSPAQQKLLLSIGILTVEDLSQVNDEGMRRIGMGALDLKRKAQAWLSQLQDKGPLTHKIAGIEAENDALKIQVQTLASQVEQLLRAPLHTVQAAPPVITAKDLIDEEEPVKRGPGRPRKDAA